MLNFIARNFEHFRKVELLILVTLFISLIVFYPTSTSAQSPVKADRKKQRRVKEKEKEKPIVIKRNGKKYILEEEELKRFDQPGEAAEFYRMKRLPKGVKDIPLEKYLAAVEKIKNMKRFSTADNKLYPSQNAAPNLREDTLAQKSLFSGKDDETNSLGGSTGGVLGTWKNLGPGNIGGRTRSLVIDPNNANTFYAGAVDGGIWKSVDAGASWVPLDDFLVNIAVTSLVIDPGNSNVLYAGTGEGFFNGDAVRGLGVFKSTDAGVTWTQLSATNSSDFYYVQDLVVSPSNSQHIYAATRTGVHRSLDGGTTWTNVLLSNAANGANGVMDLVIRTDQATDYIYAAVGTFAQSHIFRNTDAGGAGIWTDVYTESAMGRTTLALAPSNQNIIYALAAQQGNGSSANFNNGLLAVFRSTSSGDAGSWTTQTRNNSTNLQDRYLLSNPVYGFLATCGFGASNQFINQGWYDNYLAVDPTDPTVVWAAGTDLWRSDNSGTNWGVASYWWFDRGVDAQYAHADNHAIIFHPGYNGTTNQKMFVGNDGGIYQTNNAKDGKVGYAAGSTPGPGTVTSTSPICGNPVANSVTWNGLNNGYQVTQFYHGVPYPNGATYFGGTQDNGTNRGTDGGGPNSWTTILGGDGGYVAVDPTNTNVLYSEFTRLSIQKSTDGGVTFSNAVSGISESSGNFLFINSFAMDPANPQRLWTGGFYMWRTTNSAVGWTRASAITPGNGSVSAEAVAPQDGNFVFAGMTDGFIIRTNIGLTSTSSTTWSSVQPRNGFVSSITVDPNNINTVYATYSTFGGNKVYKSTDGAASFVAIDGTGANTIPDIPVHSIAVDPANSQRLYVGTDLGVFVSLDGGANWARETAGFSNVVTESLSILNNGGVSSIYAFTHGRGAFKVAIPASCVTVSPAMRTFNYVNQAGTATITKNVGATATCDWNAVSNSSFITLNSVTNLSGVDTGTLNYTLSQNNTGAQRTGTITVAGATITVIQEAAVLASPASITGRLLTPNGNPISKVSVRLSDTEGHSRFVTTSSFGYFQFEDLEVGRTYILTPMSKKYTFDPQNRVVDIFEDVTEINFVANPN